MTMPLKKYLNFTVVVINDKKDFYREKNKTDKCKIKLKLDRMSKAQRRSSVAGYDSNFWGKGIHNTRLVCKL